MADIPHFALPFRFEAMPGGTLAAATVEQDTREDIAACFEAVIRTPRGFRDELPGFGVTPPEFSQGGPDIALVRSEAEEWEARGSLLLDLDPEALDPLIRATIDEGAAGG